MRQTTTDTTFDVSPEVTPATGRLESVDYRAKLRTAFRRPVEAIWSPERDIVACDDDHALLTAMMLAFYSHYPLRLTPDVIWITIARGFAQHVNENAELLRHHFVEHKGKEKLVVHRPDFLPGSDNPWPEAFDAFTQQIDRHTGGVAQHIACDFSTTGPIEKAVSQLMAMDTFKSYFEYVLMAGCGIPRITLTGSEDDWARLREKAAGLAAFGLEQWIKALDPILEQFVCAKAGRPDQDFWRSMFRYKSSSGACVMTGWATTLFPYLEDTYDKLYANPYLDGWQDRFAFNEKQHWTERNDDPQGPAIGAVPSCFTSVPLTVFWGTEETQLRLVGGLLGVSQHGDQSVGAEPGWVIVYEEPVDPLSERHQWREDLKNQQEMN